MLFIVIKKQNISYVNLNKLAVDSFGKNSKKVVLLLASIRSIIFEALKYKLAGPASFGGDVSSTPHSVISGYVGNLVSLFNNGFIIIFLMAILFNSDSLRFVHV
jgi:hypothetical protein